MVDVDSSPTTLASLAGGALVEINEVFKRCDELKENPAKKIVSEILSAKGGKIVLHALGREGLMTRALTMRLFHMGLQVSCAGDMTCPPLGPGDLFIASVGPGSVSSVNALMKTAKEAGAKVLLITAQPDGDAGKIADEIAWLPAQTMKDDVPEKSGKPDSSPSKILPMGSVFEGALFVTFEIVIYILRVKLNETPETMRVRHTNIE